MRTLILLITFSLCASSMNAGAAAISCEQRTKSAFPGYEFTPGWAERGQPTHDPTKPYSKTVGDYDGDGKEDIALLLRPISGHGDYAISVCLSSKPSGAPELIHKAYTYGPLVTTPKGREYYDFSTDAEGRYELDGIGSYCCECCGATYILRKGKFVEVIDSD
ncbi:MAG: hypothetical protein ACYC5X_04645 [Syntrophales bacterium]